MKRILAFTSAFASVAFFAACTSSGGGQGSSAKLEHKAGECPNFDGTYVAQGARSHADRIEFLRDGNGQITLQTETEKLVINGKTQTFSDSGTAAAFCQAAQIKLVVTSSDKKISELDIFSETETGLSLKTGDTTELYVREAGPLPKTKLASSSTSPSPGQNQLGIGSAVSGGTNGLSVAHASKECPDLNGTYMQDQQSDSKVVWSRDGSGHLTFKGVDEPVAFIVNGTVQTNPESGEMMVGGCQGGEIQVKAIVEGHTMTFTILPKGSGYQLVVASEGHSETMNFSR